MRVLGMDEREWPLDRAGGAQNLRREFPALVARTRDALYATLVRIVRDERDAEDLLQDTYMRALQRLESYRGEGEPEAWLRRIAVRLALNHLRARKLRRWLPLGGRRDEEDGSEWDAQNRKQAAPDTEAARSQRRKRLASLLAEFPAKAQAAFALRHMEDRPYAEIASLLSCSEATARSLVSRTSSRLEREIRQRGWHDE